MPKFILPKPTKTTTHFNAEDQLTYVAEYFKVSALEELQLYYVAGVDAPNTQARIVRRSQDFSLPLHVQDALREEGWLESQNQPTSAAAHWLSIQILKAHPIRQYLHDEILLRTESVKFCGKEVGTGATEYSDLEVEIYAFSGVSMLATASLLEWGATVTGLKYELAEVHNLRKTKFKSELANAYIAKHKGGN